MVCPRDTRKKITKLHKKMRTVVMKHNRKCNGLLKNMKRFIEDMRKNEYPSLLNELETMTIPDSCQEYSDKLVLKLATLIHKIDYTELIENATLLKNLQRL